LPDQNFGHGQDSRFTFQDFKSTQYRGYGGDALWIEIL
jgi:hypothetical protein